MDLMVSIIIPTFKRNAIANDCIASILSCGIENLEIIVVNDNKEADFILDKKNTSTQITVLNSTGSGVACARNTGAKKARAGKFIFVDDDMLLNKESILNACTFLDKNTDSTYNANWVYETNLIKNISSTKFGRYLIHNQHTTLEGWNKGGIEWKNNSLLKTDGITSQFFALKRADFEKIGGYNETFPFAGFEDYDINMKLIKHGITNYIDTGVCIFHNEYDRVEAEQWLQRKKRGAVTRKVAVEMGFKELTIEYPASKKILLSFLKFIRPLIKSFAHLIPNASFCDPVYNRTINLLIAIYIFEGYQSK
jgi:glycosyltransferase involved in cell wall biosynthesis